MNHTIKTDSYGVVQNPSDEKLREMIIEKDQKIKQLRDKVARLDGYVGEAMLESCRLQEENTELRAKLEATQARCAKLAQMPKPEIKLTEATMKDAERYRKLKAVAETFWNSADKDVFIFQIVIIEKEEKTIDQIIDGIPDTPEGIMAEFEVSDNEAKTN